MHTHTLHLPTHGFYTSMDTTADFLARLAQARSAADAIDVMRDAAHYAASSVLRGEGLRGISCVCNTLVRFPRDLDVCRHAMIILHREMMCSSTATLSTIPDDVILLILDAMSTHKICAGTQDIGLSMLLLLSAHGLRLHFISIVTGAMLVHADDSAIQITGCICIAQVLYSLKSLPDFVDAGTCIEALVKTTADRVCSRYKAIAALATYGAGFQTRMGEAGVVETLVTCLSLMIDGHNNAYRDHTLIALRNVIIFHRANASRFVAAGGIEVVTRMLYADQVVIGANHATLCIFACIDRHQLSPEGDKTYATLLTCRATHAHTAQTLTIVTLALARLYSGEHETPWAARVVYKRLLDSIHVVNIAPIMRPLLNIVTPWYAGVEHGYFPDDTRKQIATVLVLARSNAARTRAASRGLCLVSGAVLSRLLRAVAQLAYERTRCFEP